MSKPEQAFEEPWQAQAFALVQALLDAEVFSAEEWAAALSARLHGSGVAEDGSDYYTHWAGALEDLLATRGISPAAVAEMADRWQRAAEATPHGQPVLLDAADLTR